MSDILNNTITTDTEKSFADAVQEWLGQHKDAVFGVAAVMAGAGMANAANEVKKNMSDKLFYIKFLFFVITFFYYLFLIHITTHLLAMYNPVFFIPLLLSFMAAFLHFKKFKILLILFFIFTTCLSTWPEQMNMML